MHRPVSNYRLIAPLGSGGAGQVWKAHDLRLNRTVAIKFISANSQDREAMDRLQKEARSAAALTHPNIATVHELVEHDNSFRIVMECVEGETLKSRIERGPLSIKESLDIAIQVAEALKAAHARQLLHCDIKPSNIMITPDGLVKVLDFGLAQTASIGAQRRNDLPAGISRLTNEWIDRDSQLLRATVCGTPGYVSPEQIAGESLDGRTDIFSLGVVLYEMLTGKMPFGGQEPVHILNSILRDEPPPLSNFRDDVPLEMEDIVRRALAKDRKERHATVERLLDVLRELKSSLEKEGTSERAVVESIETITSGTRFRPQHRRWFLVAGLLSASIAGAQIIIARPNGIEWAIPAVLMTVAILCVVARLAGKAGRVASLDAMPGGAAFRGLLPFQEADRKRFFGRDTDTAALFEMMKHSDFRFGVLFGESGCGKTSLLRAGLLPKLWEQGYVPLYCRAYNDPLAAAMDQCRKRSHSTVREGEASIETLRRAAQELDTTLVIVCDQFEETFVSRKSEQNRERFLSFLTACHDDATLPVKILISIRSDFLYLISSEFEGRIPNPLMSSRLYHLRNFGEDQAAEIIDRSVKQANLAFESELGRQVARDLAAEGAVLPSELQIVGERLQSKRIFTVRDYKRLGGKEPLVESFLDDIIQSSGDREGSGLLLRALISEENTRLTLTLQEIARRTQRPIQSIERILNLLIAARLLREIQDETPWRYELIHEYLIEKINQITGRVLDATQRANRLFRQYLSNYAVDKRTRVPITRVWFIRRYSDLERGERERELLSKSLRRGSLNLAALVVILVVSATAFAAWLSVSEQWEGLELSDGHTAAVRQAVFSPDGRLLVSCGEDEKVIVWDFARRERLATFTDHTGWVNAVAFSPDGKWFASASADHTVIVWDAGRLEKVATLNDHQSGVNAVTFSPDSRWLASGSEDPDLRTIVWSVGRWEKFRELPLGIGWSDLLFSKDSRRVGSAGAFWDVASGQKLSGTVMAPEWLAMWSALSPDATRMANIDGLGIVYFWDMTRRKLISKQKVHRDHGRAITFSPDGRLAASGAEDIILWDAATQTKLVRLEHTSIVWRLAFSPDGRWLVSTHGDGSILLWDVAERERVADFNEHSGAVRAVAFSPDGKRIASAGDDRSIIVWDAIQGRKEAVLIGHRTRVLSVAFSPDGKSVASTDQDGNLILWDSALRKPRWATQYLVDGKYIIPTYCVTISPDGRSVADTMGVYDSANGCLAVDFSKEYTGGQIYGADFSDDGRRLAYVTPYGHIYLWDAENWQLIDMLKSSGLQLVSVSFSPDAKLLATGDDGGKVRLWELNPLRQVAIIGQHAARIKSVAFSPDGKEVAAAGDDQSIALWDVARRRLVTRVGTHTSPVLSVAFSPDGKRLASGEYDKSVRVYSRHHVLWGFHLD
jgi:WD40 repeat protein/serine/threonine protein kinase